MKKGTKYIQQRKYIFLEWLMKEWDTILVKDCTVYVNWKWDIPIDWQLALTYDKVVEENIAVVPNGKLKYMII